MQNGHLPPSPMEKSTFKVARHALLVTALALTALMMVQSVIRRLNFDEWLVLRAGWLVASHEPSNLHFLMPWTWLAGQLAKLVASAPVLITGLRLTTTFAILMTLWWALRQQHPSRDRALQAYVLTLSCGAFIGHGVEIRYDAVVLWCWLAAWGLLARPAPTTMVALGALIAVLALHQTKGLFFAASLLTCAWLTTRRPLSTIGRHLMAGTLIPSLSWGWVLIDQGLLTEQMTIYAQFAGLRAELGTPAWADLLAQLRNDAGWWLVMLSAATLATRHRHQHPTARTTLLLGLTPMVFIALHPHPWPYMLVPCVPFLASLGVSGLSACWSTKNANHAMRSGLVAAGCICVAILSLPRHLHALLATGHHDLQTLELLRSFQTPQDRVLDPSGAAYFIKPIAPDWYLDGLFRHRITQGTWQPAPSISAQQPSIVVRSYRLDWATARPTFELDRHHEQACHWIWLRKGDARTPAMRAHCPPNGEDSLQNYWQISP